jgi:MFS family permease
VWLIFLLLGVQQSFVAVNMTTRNAVLPRLVPTDLIAPANALNSTVFMFGMVFGPLVAGAMIPVLGLSTLYLIDTVALFISTALVWRLPEMHPGNGTEVGAGLRHIVVAANSDQGVLYGAFALLRKIATGESIVNLNDTEERRQERTSNACFKAREYWDFRGAPGLVSALPGSNPVDHASSLCPDSREHERFVRQRILLEVFAHPAT